MDKITVGVLTISDRCFAGEATDESGPNLKDMLERGVVKNTIVVKTGLVSDSVEDIETVLKKWSGEHVNLILTTGGTGVSSMDVTPEATTSVLDRIIPGISQLMFLKSSQVTPLAALSRSVAGIRKKSLIVNLPGSRKASQECLEAIAGVIPHAIDLIVGKKKEVQQVHFSLAQKQSLVKVANPANWKKVKESPYEKISVSDAQKIILERIFLLRKEIVLGYEVALGHVLAQDIVSRENLPPFDVSLKDGYAIRSSEDKFLRTVIGVSNAGDQPFAQDLPHSSCVRISTGAPMPVDADAVVMVEKTTLERKEECEMIQIHSLPPKGQDVRKKGSDFLAGQLLLPARTLLDSSAIGLCAAAGITSMKVLKKPLVAVISTGDELINPADPASKGGVRDSNRITLINLLKENRFEALDLGIVKDEPNALRDALERGFRVADVVVSTGSMSMGERDYFKDVFVADFDGEIHFGRVMMKPGLPTCFGTAFFEGKMKFYFGLPGNPASAVVTSHLFVLPALRKISGFERVLPVTVSAIVETPIPLEDRPHYVRGTVKFCTEKGQWLAKVTGDQRSSRIASCVNANCLLLFPSEMSVSQGKLPDRTVNALLIGDINI